MILTVCLSPCTDITIELDSLNVGKTNIVKSKTLSFTGKALNVAIGVARLGGEPYATGLMYNENGYMFENALDKEGVPFTFVWNKGRVRENYKFIDNKSMLTEVNDVGEEVGEGKTGNSSAWCKCFRLGVMLPSFQAVSLAACLLNTMKVYFVPSIRKPLKSWTRKASGSFRR